MPSNDDGKPLGVLHVGIDSKFVEHVLLEVLLDVVVVLVVSLFFTLELLNFMAGARPPSGLGGFPRPGEGLEDGRFSPPPRPPATHQVLRRLRPPHSPPP